MLCISEFMIVYITIKILHTFFVHITQCLLTFKDLWPYQLIILESESFIALEANWKLGGS